MGNVRSRNVDTTFYPDLFVYRSTMTDNEVFTYNGSSRRIYYLDPGGADRNFNPSGTFPDGFEAVVINTGEELITFDSSGSAQVIGPGQRLVSNYDDTASKWR